MEKRAYLPRQFSDVDMMTMRRLWQIIDPQGLSNRGKMFQ